MPQNDNAVITAAIGYVYTAAAGTVAPTPSALKTIDLENPLSWTASGWTSVGHTSRGTLPEWGYDGGDFETKGSWQKKKLREVETDIPIDSVTVSLHEFNQAGLGLYYGPNAVSTPGVFGVKTSQINEKAFLVVIVDGTTRLGFHALKASIRRDDALDVPIDDLAVLPIKATFLDYGTGNVPFSWINEDLFNVAGVLPKLKLGGASGGTFTLKINGVDTAAITVAGISATTIKTALVAVDDGISASQITVTASGSDYDISIPAVLTVGTNSTTGGTGVTIV